MATTVGAYSEGQGGSKTPQGAAPVGLDYTGLGLSQTELAQTVGLGGAVDYIGLPPGARVDPANQMITFGGALTVLNEMGPDQITRIQNDLIDAGLLKVPRGRSRDEIASGEPDQATLRAYIGTLRMAYRTHTTFTDVLTQEKAKHPEIAAGTGGVPAFEAGVVEPGKANIIDLSNPKDLELVADKAAYHFLGKKATSEQKEKFIQSIQGQEVAKGRERFAAQEQERTSTFEARKTERDTRAMAAAGQLNAQSGTGAGNQDMVVAAQGFSGIPYGTDSGHLDCSALVQSAAAKVGVSLPRTTFDQVKMGDNVGTDPKNAQPGDLIFFNTDGRDNSHVGIYAGNNMMIDSPHTGSAVGLHPIQGYGAVTAIRRLKAGTGAGARSVIVGQDIKLPSTETQVTNQPSPEAEAYSELAGPESPTRLQYGAHEAATSVYDAMMKAILGQGVSSVSGGGQGSVV